MSQIGVFEIFFGPAWPDQSRLELAAFLGHQGFDFYIYAPKADQHLRKSWRDPWDEAYLSKLKTLSQTYRKNNVRFGVALSPFAYDKDSASDVKYLKEKLSLLKQIGIDSLGLFFDDMIYDQKALQAQIQAAETARSIVQCEILFCPSYYSDDPILDKVFGQRPENYLTEIGKQIPEGIEILWTGPKVISQEIPADHLQTVTDILRRKPFLCDNVFANDGPKQCKFLKIRPLTGRSHDAFLKSSGWAFNPMNQIHLSKIVVLSARNVLAEGLSPDEALQKSLRQICEPPLASWIWTQKQAFLSQNLDQLDETSKQQIRLDLQSYPSSEVSREILSWLEGAYNVGSECLTD